MDKEFPLAEHQKDYIPDVWRDYTDEEYVWWVRLLAKRSTHRSNSKKALKDIHDARNYLWMLEQMIKENNGVG